MDYISLIKHPISNDLDAFVRLFNDSLMLNTDGLLAEALSHICQRGGKRMRPILIQLIALNYGKITTVTQYAAVALELLHTASLVHDDVVDESAERRGQASVNASYDNKIAVLVGDYIISTALLSVSLTHNQRIVQILAELGKTLAGGEVLQLSNIQNQELSETAYYKVIKQKTAALFEACAKVGAISANASEEEVRASAKFGQDIGMIFQIRDDIFDYYDSTEIGKPTGNDMVEGKLTLPVIYALNHSHLESMHTLARKVKALKANPDEIAVLVEFTKEQGGIEYAEHKMEEIATSCMEYINGHVNNKGIKDALTAYLDYVIRRNH